MKQETYDKIIRIIESPLIDRLESIIFSLAALMMFIAVPIICIILFVMLILMY